MDKKTILFVVALTASFFLINTFLFPPKEYPQPAPQTAVVAPVKPKVVAKQAEDLYVIESPYQQLVFSNLGGALSEINLPLQSKENSDSVVRPIQADRILQKEYPQNDKFPLQAYKEASGNGEPKVGGYYPLLRRGIPAQYYGLATTTEEPASYRVTRLEKGLIELEGDAGGFHITKTISFPANPADAPYCFDVTIRATGSGPNLSLSTGVPEVELVSGSSSPTLKYRLTRNTKSSVTQIDLPKDSTPFGGIRPDWICNSNGFLGIILDPRDNEGSGFVVSQIEGASVPTRLSVIDAQYALYPADKYPGYDMRLTLPAEGKTTSFRVYAGPLTTDILKKVDTAYSDPKTGYNPDYTGAISFHGWFAFISEPFAKFLFFLMKIFHFVTRSWGISIILLTVALRVMLYPLNAWSIKATAKMQKIAPKVAQIQERYKKDPKRAQMEVMALYKENGVNPLGGCLPLLIQMPFLIGMFDLLKSTFQLRGASFIPGWITNLSAPDVVFSWNYPVWFFGTSFHLLPLLLGGVMYWQQSMSSTTPKDKNLWTDQQKQQKLMGNLMVVIFAVLFYHFPSGLNIYWLSSMLLGILQQSWTMKKLQLR